MKIPKEPIIFNKARPPRICGPNDDTMIPKGSSTRLGSSSAS